MAHQTIALCIGKTENLHTAVVRTFADMPKQVFLNGDPRIQNIYCGLSPLT